jgi:Cation efflux family
MRTILLSQPFRWVRCGAGIAVGTPRVAVAWPHASGLEFDPYLVSEAFRPGYALLGPLMGAGHSHGSHSGAKHRWRLALSFVLVTLFFVIELVFALSTGSLALLSDAGHMAADVVALGAALVATKIASRPDPTGRRSYGSYRAEVFASGLAVLIMLGASAYVVLSAFRRLNSEPEIPTGHDAVRGRFRVADQPHFPTTLASRR